ncbi:DNA-3-methyladenine glycosylase family protein [Siansivirga zeaxanthinifaciens]|uniref:DNA-3-methyladenine glycosylase II n=1 Tax=Siansivirga zeaxanthinifaciens CC-SAMT-1 TaxID=1454006 RepID=A0A0C5W0J2_9FLAO|nr:hypothetical protein [Siansivirga zeaxanthinifaciens]AJR04791.1 hypothetical protein AW14_04610 [Siansivirga zeaxanthinifaciens CC-SAMT-1]
MKTEAYTYLKKKDPVIKKIIEAVPYPDILSTKNIFHDLISCVVEQQIHYRSTKNIFKKLLEKAAITSLTTENFSVFEEKGLSTIKLSDKKYETLSHIIDFWKDNRVEWEMLSNEEITNKLSKIKGIGTWTIDMILLYTLDRPNIIPIDDFHLKQIMTNLYKLNPDYKLKSQITNISNNWSPYKSIAVKYLLAYKTFSIKNPLF